jgi:hypothetical protein
MKLLPFLLLLACDPNPDSLVGSWRLVNGRQVYTFNADHSLRLDTDEGGPGPGCLLRRIYSGSWNASGSSLTLTTTSATTQVNQCFDMMENQPVMDDPNAVLGTNSFSWSLNGNTLTLTTNAGTPSNYTRQ